MIVVPTVVVDTSVHVSGEVFAKKGSPAKETLARAFALHFHMAMSEMLFAEIARKLVETGAPADTVADYLVELRLLCRAFWFPDGSTVGLHCPDPDDLFVLALARTSNAVCVVSQDSDLVQDDALPRGCSPGFFLARLREWRSEPKGQRFP